MALQLHGYSTERCLAFGTCGMLGVGLAPAAAVGATLAVAYEVWQVLVAAWHCCCLEALMQRGSTRCDNARHMAEVVRRWGQAINGLLGVSQGAETNLAAWVQKGKRKRATAGGKAGGKTKADATGKGKGQRKGAAVASSSSSKARAISPYFAFQREMREEAKKQLPAGATVGQVAKVLGQMWRELPAEGKAKYQGVQGGGGSGAWAGCCPSPEWGGAGWGA